MNQRFSLDIDSFIRDAIRKISPIMVDTWFNAEDDSSDAAAELIASRIFLFISRSESDLSTGCRRNVTLDNTYQLPSVHVDIESNN